MAWPVELMLLCSLVSCRGIASMTSNLRDFSIPENMKFLRLESLNFIFQGFYVVFDPSSTTTISPTPTSTTTERRPVSLDGSSGIKMSKVLQPSSSFSLGLRMCKGPSDLLMQSGGSGDNFKLKSVDRNVILSYSLGFNRSKEVEHTLATNLELETWYKIHWNVSEEIRVVFYEDGNGSDFISVTLNSTLEDDMRSIDLSNGTELVVGRNFTGCLTSGEQIDLSPFSTGNCFLDAGRCPKVEDVNSCANITCQNNGSCLVERTIPRCVCQSGFNGTFCEDVVRPGNCNKSSCLNGGTCVEKDGKISCSCVQEVIGHFTDNFTSDNSSYKLGYEGEFCENWIDACSLTPNVCIEGACKKDPRRPLGFTCFCPQGEDFRVGEYCQYKTDICQVGSKCQNGGTCVSLGGERFRCTCAPGFTGKNCQVNIDECVSDPCLNNGTCVDGVNSFSCSCLNGTVGILCQTNINECVSAPCLNGGQCIDLINGFKCNCSNTGYEGVLCQTEADECLSSPCRNGGTCQDLLNGYSCTCYTGYTGHECEVDIDECLSDPCLNDGYCYQNNLLNPNPANNSGHHCLCSDGFVGPNCEVNIDECVSSPCKHGECEDLTNDFSCTCHPGYEGELCDTKINLCDRQPCDQGICIEEFPHYKCICTNESEVGGSNCSVPLTGCNGVSCNESTICTPLFSEAQSLHGHRCDCPQGFAGPNCQVDTSLSFGQNSSLILKMEGLRSVSFKFKAIPERQHLLTVATTSFILTLECDHRCIRVHHSEDPARRPLTRDVCPKIAFDTSNWSQIDVQLNDSIVVHLHHKGCLGELCIVSVDGTSRSNESAYLHFGRIYKELHSNLSLSSVFKEVMSRDFLGCLSDLKLNDEHVEINMTNDVILISRLNKGCTKTLQCNNTCENGGSCVDLWNDFRCNCERTFYGKTCSQVMESATFGHDLKSSFLNFHLPKNSRSTDLQWHLEVSTMIRTRDDDGFLFFIQLDEGNSSSVGHVSCEIINGSISVSAKFSENEDEQALIKTSFRKFLDGKKYFMKVTSNSTALSLRMDSDEHFIYMNFTKVFPIKVMQVYIGGMNKGEKNKRALPYGFQTAKNFVGWLQDFRVNDIVFDLACNGSGMNISDKVVTSDCRDVMPGEVTGDICSLRSPCGNGSTCTNVFYNDYKCTCPKNFLGVDCKEMTFCSIHPCPKGSFCHDHEYGFECLKNVSIKTSVRFLLDLKGEDLKNATLKFKTNSKIVRLLRMDSIKVKSCIISVDLINDKLLLRFNDLTVQSLHLGQTDQWHDINIQILPQGVAFVSVNATASMTIDGSCFNSTALLEVRISDDINNFEGCFSAVRVNNILLPFFRFEDLREVTSFHDRFIELSVGDIGICQSDDACQSNPCKSGGTCQKDYDSFSCSCPSGFEGSTCEICSKGDCTQNCSPGAICNGSCNGDCKASPILTRGQLIGIIVGTVACALLLVLVNVIIYSVVKIKAKRAKQGVYNPSMEEAVGASVQFNDALKIPQEERLI